MTDIMQRKPTMTILTAHVAAPSVDMDALCALKTSEEMIAFERAFQEADGANYVTNADGSEVWSNRVLNDGELSSKPIRIDAALAKIRDNLNEDEGWCGEAEPFELRDEGDHYVAVGYMHSCVWYYADGTTREI